MGKVKYPFGPADNLTPTPDAEDGTVVLTIDNQLTFVKPEGLTEECEVTLNPSADLEPGAEVIIDVEQGATPQDVVWGADIVAPELTGVANDRDKITLTWNGSEWIGGVWEKIVNAA